MMSKDRMVMDLETAKLNLMQKLLSVGEMSLIDKLNTILDKEMIVGYTVEGKPLTNEHYNQRLQKAEQQILSGNFTSQEDLERESENW